MLEQQDFQKLIISYFAPRKLCAFLETNKETTCAALKYTYDYGGGVRL